MDFGKSQSGFSLFELLIAIAVIGLLSAFAVPAYRSYIDTANMTKVSANFEQGIRLAQNTFAQHRTRVAIGLPTPIPNDVQGWIDLLNSSGVEAPGGGPAYIESTNNKTTGRGDPITGAIGVDWQPYAAAKVTKKGKFKAEKEPTLDLWRPLYSSLREQRATITADEVDIKNQRKPD